MPASTLSCLDELERKIRSALAHLYDSAFLQTHPLARMVDAQQHWDDLSRAQHLRRTLLDCIESLRPSVGRSTPLEAARAYAVLTYRYVDSLSMEELTEKLALSRRQVYREHEKGIHAIARLLADRHNLCTPTERSADADPTAMRSEIDRLRSSARRDTLTVKQILDGVLTLLQPMANDAGIRLDVKYTDESICLVGDRVMLRQALIGMLAHSIEFTAHNVLVHVSVSGSFVEIVIETDLMPDAPAPDDAELQLLSALIEAQLGRSAISQSHARRHARIALPTCATTTLLVIDDNADLVELFRRYLAGHRIEVVGASDGRAALQIAAALAPSLITVDVMMPGIDGWEMLQQLKESESTRNTPVVVCSVLREARLALSMGAAGYLTKPVSQREFLEMTQRWLGPLQPAE